MNKEQRKAQKTAKKASKRKAYVAQRSIVRRGEQIKRTEILNAFRYMKVMKRMQREKGVEKTV